MKTETRDIELLGISGGNWTESVLVPVGNQFLCTHKRLGVWRITHIPSGLCVTFPPRRRITRKPMALRLAVLMEKIGGQLWNFTTWEEGVECKERLIGLFKESEDSLLLEEKALEG